MRRISEMHRIKGVVVREKCPKAPNIFWRVFAAFFIVCSLHVPAIASDVIVMGSNDAIDSSNGKFYNMLYSEAFRRLGIRFEYRFMPAKRASAMADAGQIDGEVARIREYGDAHPTLVRVEEAGMHDSFSAFATDASISLNGWDALRNTSLRVDYLRGVYRTEEKLQALVPPDSLFAVNSIEQALKKIAKGRADIYIDSEAAVTHHLSLPEFQKAGIQKVGEMEETRYYAYLNIKHKELAVKLAAILKKMREDGTMAKLRALSLSSN